MPIYEYRCSSCGMQKEFLQKMSDDLLTDCPSCGAQGTLNKMLSAAGFQLKGSGWYATDFKGTKPAAPAAAAGDTAAPATAAAAGSEVKTESKAESKAESAPPAAHVHSSDCSHT
ncbi:MAG: zinc ribbon domain-containing protein [Burkholderiales bacterium]